MRLRAVPDLLRARRASLVEFVREPDVGIGYLAFGWVTMGQLLSLPMLLVGHLR